MCIYVNSRLERGEQEMKMLKDRNKKSLEKIPESTDDMGKNLTKAIDDIIDENELKDDEDLNKTVSLIITHLAWTAASLREKEALKFRVTSR
jgi:hypothetical protein